MNNIQTVGLYGSLSKMALSGHVEKLREGGPWRCGRVKRFLERVELCNFFNRRVKFYNSLSYMMILYSTIRPLHACMKVFFLNYCKKVKIKGAHEPKAQTAGAYNILDSLAWSMIQQMLLEHSINNLFTPPHAINRPNHSQEKGSS